MNQEVLTTLQSKAKEYGADLASEEFAKAMDQNDSLNFIRTLFHYPKMKDLPHVNLSEVDPEADSIYFCGNSLGLCPKEAEELVKVELDKWAKWGVYGHTAGALPWAECDHCVEDQMARIVGAKPEEVAIMNGLTVNLHVLMLSFYEPTKERHKILLESKAFPSDHYAVETQIKFRGFNPDESMLCLSPRDGESCLRTEDILDVIEKEGASIAVVMLSGIQYYTGQLFDMKTITAAAQKKGILVGYDLAHAVGCIAGAYINQKHALSKPAVLQGWWGHERSTRFVMDNEMKLIPGVQGYRMSNPSGLNCATIKASLNVYDKTTLTDLRKKSVLLTGYLEWMIRKHFSKSESNPDLPHINIFTPTDPEQRGCQLSLNFSININAIFKKLTEHGVVCDERYPSVIRIAPVHLYNSYYDVYRFIHTLKKVLFS